jgi:hypothetical protein
MKYAYECGNRTADILLGTIKQVKEKFVVNVIFNFRFDGDT